MQSNLSPSLHVAASGPQDAPVLLFLHGGGGTGWMWQPVIQHLSDYRCLVPDLPEHGKSRSIGPFSMTLAAEKAAEVIQNQSRGGKAVVVGLSEGAQVTVQLLANYPELIEKAVVSSALLRSIPGTGWAANPSLLRWTHRLAVAPFRNSDYWIRLNMKYSAGIPDQYYPQFKQDFQQMDENAFANLMVANQRFRLPTGLGRAAAPTLVVVGKKEYAVMRQSARDLAAALPQARLAQIDLGKGSSLAEEHNWALTVPELFARTVRAWVEGTNLPEELKNE